LRACLTVTLLAGGITVGLGLGEGEGEAVVSNETVEKYKLLLAETGGNNNTPNIATHKMPAPTSAMSIFLAFVISSFRRL
jgi:hypothetical protein